MKLLSLVCAIVIGITASGCVVHDHGRHGRGAHTKTTVVVPVPVVKAPAKHCPPGQAKKGNC